MVPSAPQTFPSPALPVAAAAAAAAAVGTLDFKSLRKKYDKLVAELKQNEDPETWDSDWQVPFQHEIMRGTVFEELTRKQATIELAALVHRLEQQVERKRIALRLLKGSTSDSDIVSAACHEDALLNVSGQKLSKLPVTDYLGSNDTALDRFAAHFFPEHDLGKSTKVVREFWRHGGQSSSLSTRDKDLLIHDVVGKMYNRLRECTTKALNKRQLNLKFEGVREANIYLSGPISEPASEKAPVFMTDTNRTTVCEKEMRLHDVRKSSDRWDFLFNNCLRYKRYEVGCSATYDTSSAQQKRWEGIFGGQKNAAREQFIRLCAASVALGKSPGPDPDVI